MRILMILTLSLTGCSHPVTQWDWIMCNVVCEEDMLLEACNHPIKGLGCKCFGGDVIWMEDR